MYVASTTTFHGNWCWRPKLQVCSYGRALRSRIAPAILKPTSVRRPSLEPVAGLGPPGNESFRKSQGVAPSFRYVFSQFVDSLKPWSLKPVPDAAPLFWV